MKKLIIVITSCFFMFAFVFIVLMLINNNMEQQTKINKGIKEFGTDYCQGHSRLDPVGYAFTNWKCEICGYASRESNTNVPEICSKCAALTGRCQKCGKVENYIND